MRPLRQASVDLARPLLHDRSGARVAPKPGVAKMIQVLRQSDLQKGALQSQQLFGQPLRIAVRYEVYELHHVHPHRSVDVDPIDPKLVDDRLEEDSGGQQRRISHSDIVEQDQRGSTRMQHMGVMIVREQTLSWTHREGVSREQGARVRHSDRAGRAAEPTGH